MLLWELWFFPFYFPQEKDKLEAGGQWARLTPARRGCLTVMLAFLCWQSMRTYESCVIWRLCGQRLKSLSALASPILWFLAFALYTGQLKIHTLIMILKILSVFFCVCTEMLAAHSSATSWGTLAQSNLIWYSSSAINPAFTKIIIFSFDRDC